MQLALDTVATLIEAEVSVTAASMKLHRASRIAIAAREAMNSVESRIRDHVRVSGLSEAGLIQYYVARNELVRALGAAKTTLIEAEELEADAELDWEAAVSRLAELQQEDEA